MRNFPSVTRIQHLNRSPLHTQNGNIQYKHNIDLAFNPFTRMLNAARPMRSSPKNTDTIISIIKFTPSAHTSRTPNQTQIFGHFETSLRCSKVYHALWLFRNVVKRSIAASVRAISYIACTCMLSILCYANTADTTICVSLLLGASGGRLVHV